MPVDASKRPNSDIAGCYSLPIRVKNFLYESLKKTRAVRDRNSSAVFQQSKTKTSQKLSKFVSSKFEVLPNFTIFI